MLPINTPSIKVILLLILLCIRVMCNPVNTTINEKIVAGFASAMTNVELKALNRDLLVKIGFDCFGMLFVFLSKKVYMPKQNSINPPSI